jgi:hypothetical protein
LSKYGIITGRRDSRATSSHGSRPYGVNAKDPGAHRDGSEAGDEMRGTDAREKQGDFSRKTGRRLRHERAITEKD